MAINNSEVFAFDLFTECLDRSYLKPLYNEVLACIVLLFVLAILFIIKIFKNYILRAFSSDEMPHMQSGYRMERSSGHV